MASHGKVDMLINSGSTFTLSEPVTNEWYVGFYNLFAAMTASGEVTRIAYNTGSAASGNGLGYHDSGNSAGENTWSLWRFNSHSNRSWEWYMLVQAASSNNFGVAPGNPAAIDGDINGDDSSMGIAVAVSVNTSSGVTSNPWGGTTNNDGNDNKGTPVWVTGAVGDTLYVIPRSNEPGGTFATDKENMIAMLEETGTTEVPWRLHFFASEDGFSWFADRNNTGTITSTHMGYVGVYEPRVELTESIKTPLVGQGQFGSFFGADNIGLNSSFLTTENDSGLITNRGANFAFRWGEPPNWARSSDFGPNNFLPSPATEITPIDLIVADGSDRGYVGRINTDIFRFISNVQVNSTDFSETIAAFGDNVTITQGKIATPWTASIGGPGSGVSRTGSFF